MKLNQKTRFGQLKSYIFDLSYDYPDPEYLLYLQYKAVRRCGFPMEVSATLQLIKNNVNYEVKYTAFNVPHETIESCQIDFLKHMQQTKPTKKQAGFPAELIIDNTKFKLCYVSSLGV